MRRRPHPVPHEQSPAKLLTVSVGALVGFFALLVAAAFPAVTLAALFGAASVPVVRRLRRLVDGQEGLCIPWTDICLRIGVA
ncbi:hypothetical protein [Halobacteriaceae bacterium SHR40]|uniref:hypothetical protein n=1 Tax=Halovenus amylolytica TaxID=2500550 RepID=UPI000FE33B7A